MIKKRCWTVSLFYWDKLRANVYTRINKNCIDATAIEKAKINYLNINAPFFENKFVTAYIYVLPAMVKRHPKHNNLDYDN